MSDDTDDTLHELDFGEDAGALPPTEPAFDAWLQRAAPSLNAPGKAPRAEMWQAIEQAQMGSARVTPRRIRVMRSLGRRWMVPIAIAASLLLGIALDRVALRSSEPEREKVVATSSSPTAAISPAGRSGPSIRPTPRDASSRLYRLAAQQTLVQAEALLTVYRAGEEVVATPESARQLGTWGRQVLSSTRLLLDSPAGSDAELRALLGDLELMLVQIIQLSGAPLDSSDRALIDRAMIDRAMRERDLLPRIRTAVPDGIAGAATGE